MRIFRNALSFLLMLVLVQVTVNHEVSAAEFKDVTTFKTEINYLTQNGIINGYPDGTFRPDQPITRMHAVKMIMREIGMPDNWEPQYPHQFWDVKPGTDGHREIMRAYELSIISGKDWNIFDPNGKMTRAEMAKVLIQAYHLGNSNTAAFKDVPQNAWHRPYVTSLASVNVTLGYPDGTFKPNLPISRAHFAVFMARILNPSYRTPTDQVKGVAMQELGDLKALDAVKDPADPMIYLIEANTNSLVAINHVTNEKKSVPLRLPAERMALKNGKLYITQLHQPHAHVRNEEDQKGEVAVYDAKTLQLVKSIPVDVDPFDIEVDNGGILYVSSGSGQWTRLESYSTATGELISTVYGIREQSLIRLNPSATRIYALGTTDDPRIRSYLNNGGILAEGVYSPHSMRRGTHLEMTSNGRHALVSSGVQFLLNGRTDGTDMLEDYDADFYGFTSFAESQPRKELYFSRNEKNIRVNSSSDMKMKYHLAAYGEVEFMFTDSKRNELIMLSKVKSGKSRTEVLAIEKVLFKP